MITVDTMGIFPTPIVIYSVESELNSFVTEDNNRQNLDNTQKLNNNMMQTRGGDGEQGHLL
jgi:hypothetical protein